MTWTLSPFLATPTEYVQVLARFVENSRDRGRQRGALTASTIVTAFAVVFVVLRTISRFWLMHNPGVDDGLLILATFVLVAFLVGMGVAIGNHAGYPSSELEPGGIQVLSKFALLVEVAYYFNICFIKCSIVLTYLRFAVSRLLRRLCYGTIVFHVLLCIGSVVAVFSQTSPLSRMWTEDGNFRNYRINVAVLFYVTAGINIATDFWILILPVNALSKIRRPRGEKIILFCIFGAGLFASIASIIRLYSISVYVNADDHLRNSLSLLLWCMIEMAVAICCASVTGMRPIWLWLLRRRSRRDLDPNGHKKSRANMNSFFMHKNRLGGSEPVDEEAQVQERPPGSSPVDEQHDHMSSNGTTYTTVTQSSQTTKVSSNAQRSSYADEAIAMGAMPATAPPREMKQVQQQQRRPTVVYPPLAVTRNTLREEPLPSTIVSQQLSEYDYHKWV